MAQSLSKIYILRIKAFALSGRGDSTMREPQGVASLALGYVLHWAFSPSLLNPKLQLAYIKNPDVLSLQSAFVSSSLFKM